MKRKNKTEWVSVGINELYILHRKKQIMDELKKLEGDVSATYYHVSKVPLREKRKYVKKQKITSSYGTFISDDDKKLLQRIGLNPYEVICEKLTVQRNGSFNKLNRQLPFDPRVSAEPVGCPTRDRTNITHQHVHPPESQIMQALKLKLQLVDSLLRAMDENTLIIQKNRILNKLRRLRKKLAVVEDEVRNKAIWKLYYEVAEFKLKIMDKEMKVDPHQKRSKNWYKERWKEMYILDRIEELQTESERVIKNRLEKKRSKKMRRVVKNMLVTKHSWTNCAMDQHDTPVSKTCSINNKMVWCQDSHMEEEDMDDPITLMPDGMCKLLPAGTEVYSPSKTLDDTTSQLPQPRAEKTKASDRTVQATSYAEKNFLLPVTFFDIPRNVRLLTECRPLTVQMVDYVKNPHYMKKQISKIICSTKQIQPYKNNNALQDLVHGEMSTNSDVLYVKTTSLDCNLIDPCSTPPISEPISTHNPDTECQNITTESLNKNNKDFDSETPGNFNVGSKILKRKPGPKRFTSVNFKKNQGLVGLKIIRKSDIGIQQTKPMQTCFGTASSSGTKMFNFKQNCNIESTTLTGNISADSFLGQENLQKVDKQSRPSFLNKNPVEGHTELNVNTSAGPAKKVSLSITKITRHPDIQQAQPVLPERKCQLKEDSYPSFIKALNKESMQIKKHIDNPSKIKKQKTVKKIKHMKVLIHINGERDGDIVNTNNTVKLTCKNSKALKKKPYTATVKEKSKSKIGRHNNDIKKARIKQNSQKFTCTVSSDNTLPAKIVHERTSYPPGLSNVDIDSVSNNRTTVIAPNPYSQAEIESNKTAVDSHKHISQLRPADLSRHVSNHSTRNETSINSITKSHTQDCISKQPSEISTIGNNSILQTVLPQKDTPKMSETINLKCNDKNTNTNTNNVAKLCELKIKTVSQINYKIGDLYKKTSDSKINTNLETNTNINLLLPEMKTENVKHEVEAIGKPCDNNMSSKRHAAQENVAMVGEPIQSVTRVYNKVNPHPDPKQYVPLNVPPFQPHPNPNQEQVCMGPLPTLMSGNSEQTMPKVADGAYHLQSHNAAHLSYNPNFETPNQFDIANTLKYPKHAMPEANRKGYFTSNFQYYENPNLNAPPYQMQPEQFPLQTYGNCNYSEWTHTGQENFANNTWQQPQLAYNVNTAMPIPPNERFNNDYMNQANMNYCQLQFYDGRFLPPPPPPPLLPPPPPPPPQPVPIPRRANNINLIDVQSLSNERTQKREKSKLNKVTPLSNVAPAKEMNQIVVLSKKNCKSQYIQKNVSKSSSCESKKNTTGDCPTVAKNLPKVCGLYEPSPTSTAAKKYSPPILPIPSVQKSMEILTLIHTLTNKFQNKEPFRSQVSASKTQTKPRNDTNYSVVKVTSEPIREKNNESESLNGVKKISLDEYKQRSKNHKFIDLTGDDDATIKNSPIKNVHNTNNNTIKL